MSKQEMYQFMKNTVDEFYDHDPKDCKLRLCLDLTLYLTGSIQSHKDALLYFYQKSIELMGGKVTYYLSDVSNKYKKRRKDTLDVLPYWLDHNENNDCTILHLLTDEKKKSCSESSFDLQMYDDDSGSDEEAIGYLRLTLPIDFILNDIQPYLSLCLDISKNLRFRSGHAGFGTIAPYGYNAFEGGRHYMVSRRFRGIDFGQPYEVCRFVESHIKCVNWLTFLGDTLVDKVGGRKNLENKLHGNAVIHSLNHGVAIQAGAEPLFGDVNKKELLLNYHAVGKALAPIRAGAAEYRRWGGIGGPINTNEWLARFD